MKKRKKKKVRKKSSFVYKVVRFMFFTLPYYVYLFIKLVVRVISRIIVYMLSLLIRMIKYSERYSSRKKQIKIEEHKDDFRLIKSIKGNYPAFEKDLFTSESKIGLILGARGSGKTAVGMRLLEKAYAKTRKNCYAIGFSARTLPSWINTVSDISEISNNSFVLIDEGGILFSSRSSMTNANKILSEIILIARHKNLTILFISQNSSNIEINVLRQADFLVLKPSSLLQKDFERKLIHSLYDSISKDFERYSKFKGLTYIYSDRFTGFINHSLPSFWKERISKSFSNKRYLI